MLATRIEVPNTKRLPDQSETPLKLPHPLGAGIDSDMSAKAVILSIRVACCRIKNTINKARLDVSLWNIPHNMIGYVKDLDSTLNVESLVDPEVLEKRHVPELLSITMEGIATK
jgi:hypothetical protein